VATSAAAGDKDAFVTPKRCPVVREELGFRPI
jgi:hypothetical protein